MSHAAGKRNFWFRGSTLVLGGWINEPFSQTVNGMGSCVLPPSGGFAAKSLEGFAFQNIVSFKSATCTVAGRRFMEGGDEVAETMVTVSIEHLNVLDIITADAVVARIVSRHPGKAPDPNQRPFGSHFENLRVGGIPVRLRADNRLIEDGDHAVLVGNHGGEATVGRDDAQDGKQADQAFLAPLFEMDGKQASDFPAGCKACGPGGLYVPGFGAAYFGEYLVTRASRRLTMLRIDLGCPVTGNLVLGYADVNGHWDP